MGLKFKCPRCRRKYEVKATLAGRRATCAGCGQTLRIPTLELAEEALRNLVPPPVDPVMPSLEDPCASSSV